MKQASRWKQPRRGKCVEPGEGKGKQEGCTEKQRNSTVEQLMDSLERLKKECKAQVRLLGMKKER